MKIKVCSKCFKDKLLSEFHKNKAAKDGLYSQCKLCSVDAAKKWAEENKERRKVSAKKYYNKKRNFLNEYKKSLKCQGCGETHPACLVFHHRDPKEKGFSIGARVKDKSVEQILDEIAKCDVLCANCHSKLHYSLKKDD